MKRSPMRRTGFKAKAIVLAASENAPTEPAKRRKGLSAVGKKGSEWVQVRARLKKEFGWAGIQTCEMRFSGCWFNDALGFAHCRKRRHLTEFEIWHVALSCNVCHDKLELMQPEEMPTFLLNMVMRMALKFLVQFFLVLINQRRIRMAVLLFLI